MSDETRARVGGADLQAGWRDPPGMGRIVAVSGTTGVVLSLVGVTLGMMATGQVWQSALGLGAFVALWGGLGFGFMIGGVVYLTRMEDAAKAAAAAASHPRRTEPDNESAAETPLAARAEDPVATGHHTAA